MNLYALKIGRVIYVHRLVYEAFKCEIHEGMEIDHIDRNKRNNNPNNLRVVTHKDNVNNPLTREYMSEVRKGKIKSEFGRKFKEHFGITSYENPKLYYREIHWYYNHNKKCRWE